MGIYLIWKLGHCPRVSSFWVCLNAYKYFTRINLKKQKQKMNFLWYKFHYQWFSLNQSIALIIVENQATINTTNNNNCKYDQRMNHNYWKFFQESGKVRPRMREYPIWSIPWCRTSRARVHLARVRWFLNIIHVVLSRFIVFFECACSLFSFYTSKFFNLNHINVISS